MKRFEMTVTLDDDGRIDIEENNDGFDPIEIIGLLELKKQDIIRQTALADAEEYEEETDEEEETEEVEDNAED